MTVRDIIKIYSAVQRKILLFGETAMGDAKFQAFRKLVIEEFGHGGTKDKLQRLFDKSNRHGR